MPARVAFATLVVLALLGSAIAAAADLVEDPIATALALCRDVDSLSADDKDGQRLFLESGIAVAEQAVAAHPDDAKAQLALCCILGKQLEVSGVSWRVMQRVNRLKAVVDAAVRLAPEDPDVLVAKGELLHQLPCMLGGDQHEAEQLLRLAIAKNPEHLHARLYLAQLLAERHDTDARREAEVALSLAQHSGTPREVAEARALYGTAPR
jgi:hypothetical protein